MEIKASPSLFNLHIYSVHKENSLDYHLRAVPVIYIIQYMNLGKSKKERPNGLSFFGIYYFMILS